MEDFNAYWTIEKTRRRKRWPARYKTILKAHLSPEEIKERVYNLREHPSVLSQRHICDCNPIISPEDNRQFSEERLRERLESLGADTKIFSMNINVSAKSQNKRVHVAGRTYNYVREVVDIHFGEIGRSPENISIEDNAFDKLTLKNAIVFVPKGCEDAYRNCKSFAKFQHICSID